MVSNLQNNWSWGVRWRNIVLYYAFGAKCSIARNYVAQIWQAWEARPPSIANQFVRELWDSGCEDLAICETEFKLHTNILHFPAGGGVTHYSPFTHFEGFQHLGKSTFLMPTTLWSYYLNKKYLGAKSQWKKLEIHVYNVHHGKLLIILWYSSDGICESQVRGCNLVGQGFRV